MINISMEFNIKNGVMLETRKLMKSGTSTVVTIPTEWLKEHGLEAGQEVLMLANGDLHFMTLTKDNVDRVNKEITNLRKELAHNITLTRSDDDRTGETREALVSPTNTKTSDSK